MESLDLPISDHLGADPHAVEASASLRHAVDLMQAYGIRHLPVLQDGRVAGLLRECDLNVIESYDPQGFELLQVRAVMSLDVLLVPPAAPLRGVVRTMEQRRYDHAIVIEGRALVGIFTVTDALRLLAAAAPGADERRTACARGALSA